MHLRSTIVVTVLVGCSASQLAPTAPPAAPVSPPIDAAVSMLSNDPAASITVADEALQSNAPMPPVVIVPGERREVPTPPPRVRITAPAANSTLRTDRVEVRLDIQNWRLLGDANDQRHVSLLLDDTDPVRVDDPTRPVPLEHLSQGTHLLRALAVWETGESVKTPGAQAVVVFHVGTPSRDFDFNPRRPLLTYSRPRGRLEGAAADRILLDFYLANLPDNQLGPRGYRVRPSIDGAAHAELTAWVPCYIDHLPDGEHTITLELLGPNGQLVPGPFNRTEQRVFVRRTVRSPESNPMVHGARAGAATPSP